MEGEGTERPENREHVFGGSPPVRLYVPTDWIDLLADGGDADAAQRRYDRLVERVFPNAPPDARRDIVGGLQLWRERLWSKGMLAHGIVNVPPSGDESAVFWHVFIVAVRLPPASPELNSASMLAQLVGQSDLSFARHVETFRTDMGVGLGMFGRQPMTRPGAAATPPPNGNGGRGRGRGGQQNGMAAALSYAPGAEYGLAAVGVSLDPAQDEDVGRLVALIAGRSTFVTDETKGA